MTVDDHQNWSLARAKINLTLHLRGQRSDGYHLLQSLVVFPEIGDLIRVSDGKEASLRIGGPFSECLPADSTNLVVQAAHRLASANGIAADATIELQKLLPIASGIGGGSSDAAMTLRLLSDLWGVTVPPDLPLDLGADVPVCLAAPQPMVMSGIGEELEIAPSLPQFWIVLLNPGVGMATPAVFAEVADKTPTITPALPNDGFQRFDDFVGWLNSQRNDLQAAAIRICPEIAIALRALEGTSSPLVRMSGSGATCFAIFNTEEEAARALSDLSQTTSWWVQAAQVGTA